MRKFKFLSVVVAVAIVILSMVSLVGCGKKDNPPPTAIEILDSAYASSISKKNFKINQTKVSFDAYLNDDEVVEYGIFNVSNDGSNVKVQNVDAGGNTIFYGELTKLGLNFLFKNFAINGPKKTYTEHEMTPLDFADNIANLKTFKDLYQKRKDAFDEELKQDSSYGDLNSISVLEKKDVDGGIEISYKLVETTTVGAPSAVLKRETTTVCSVVIKNGVFAQMRENVRISDVLMNEEIKTSYSSTVSTYAFESLNLITFDTTGYTKSI